MNQKIAHHARNTGSQHNLANQGYMIHDNTFFQGPTHGSRQSRPPTVPSMPGSINRTTVATKSNGQNSDKKRKRINHTFINNQQSSLTGVVEGEGDD